MGAVQDKLKELGKETQPDKLTAVQWEPVEKDKLIGFLVHREVITRKEDGRVYDKVTLKTDNGLFDTIIKSGILALSDPPVKRGDIFIITYNGMKDLDGGKKRMHDTTVEIYHCGEDEGLPF